MTLRNLIASKIGIPIQDALKRQSVSKDIALLEKTWKISTDGLEHLRTVKLRNLIERSFSGNTFYNSRMQACGLSPEDIKSIEDLKKLPALERNDVTSLAASIPRIGRKTVRGTSSGSTGVPISFFKDSSTLSMGKAGLYFGRMATGWRLGDKTVNVWGNPKTVNTLWTRPSSRLNAHMQNELRIPACNLSTAEDMKRAIDRIVSSGAEYLSGYTNSIKSIAGFVAEKGTALNFRRVFTTAETLLGPDRELIERYLGPVSDSYGCSEVNGVAFQCPCCGFYHTVDPHVIVEFEPHEDGCHSLLITDLDNMTMPFIRYRVGDLAELECSSQTCFSGTKWSCFKSIRGRISSIIKISGMYINPITYFGDSLGRLLNSFFDEHVSYQTIWDGCEFTTTLFFVAPPDNESMSRLNGEMDNRLAKFNTKHRFEFSIEKPSLSSSGKSMFFINRAEG